MSTNYPDQDVKEIWSAGDFAAIGSSSVIVGEILCEAVELRAKERVLDVATGSGNTALSAARRACRVVGIDIVPSLLAKARRRAEAEGLRLDLLAGDAQTIPFSDRSFEVVLSTFGCMFAPDQERAVAELLRVCRSGGRIGLASWSEESFPAHLLRAIGKYSSSNAGRTPIFWGTRKGLETLFGDGILSLKVTERVFLHRGPSAEAFLQKFVKYFGPLVTVYGTLDDGRKKELFSELVSTLNRMNSSGNDTLRIKSEYLEAVAVKKV